jgi:lysophospholipase
MLQSSRAMDLSSSMTDLLVDMPDNPAPEGITAASLKMRDGKRLRYALAPATERPFKGTVIILHGRNECIEKYYETAGDLARRGLATAMFDWRGQGGSDRLLRDSARGHIKDFSHYVRDLEHFFEEIVLPDCRGPFFILAHSTGSLVALLAAPAMINRVKRMVLVSPLLSFASLPVSLKTVRRLTGFLRVLGFGSRYLGGGPRPKEFPPFSTNILTTDRERYARNAALCTKAPQLTLGAPTIAWVSAAARAMDIVHNPDFIARIHVPILMVAAGADEVVSTPAVEDYARRLRSGSLLTIDGARHEILQEADIYREQFFAAFDAFVPGEDL